MLGKRSDFSMQARLRDAGAAVADFLRRVAGCHRSIVCVPRADVHRIVFDIRGVPARLLRSSLRLRLQQHLGAGQYGFCYQSDDGNAELWYWRELEGAQNLYQSAATRGAAGEPWPEPLLREPLRDGVHIVACVRGYEGVVVRAQRTVQTRWFPEFPDIREWSAFVRDAGGAPGDFSPPPALDVRQISRAPRGWRLCSSLIRPVSGAILAALGVVSIAGALVVIAVAYGLKLDRLINAETAAYEKLTKDHAETIALQKEIDSREAFLSRFRGVRPRNTQLELMNSLQESGVLGEGDKVSLAEWEYRDGRLRLQFAVSVGDFALGQFLATVEKLPAFGEIRLIPDTPQGTIGIQASIVTDAPDQASGKTALVSRAKP